MKKPYAPEWFKRAVFYEIYPQSFSDSNNDGIGDLPGITKNLDYIAESGFTALWLNPCFVSPFHDGGYDVADYYQIAPRYGTNNDLKTLVKEALKRNINIILDLVPGHTSIQHPWFTESCRAEKNRYTDRYIWTDEAFGPSPKDFKTVNGYGERDGQYVTNFFYCQPALNFGFAHIDKNCTWQKPSDHPEALATRNEIKKIMRFWLDMGISGFRVDMAHSCIKNDKNFKKNMELWQEIRSMMDNDYKNAVLIAEWPHPQFALKAGFHSAFILPWGEPQSSRLFYQGGPGWERYEKMSGSRNACFFNSTGSGDASIFFEQYLKLYRKTQKYGYMSFVSGNHDLHRLAMNRTPEDLQIIFAFLLTMPGVPFIYYGDEIGMKYINLPSKEGGYFRTGARTPMQWNTKKNAGFSCCTPENLYLPVDPDSSRPCVQEQKKNRKSLLNTVMELVNLRKKHQALQADGEFHLLYCGQNKSPLVYMREDNNEKIMTVLNPLSRAVTIKISDKKIFDIREVLAGKGIEIFSFSDKRAARRSLTIDCAAKAWGIVRIV
ncbi:MAG TPA: glycosylase [Spirochaetia bacterium]|nr:glycosylase [Spirochaetia bacterium]